MNGALDSAVKMNSALDSNHHVDSRLTYGLSCTDNSNSLASTALVSESFPRVRYHDILIETDNQRDDSATIGSSISGSSCEMSQDDEQLPNDDGSHANSPKLDDSNLIGDSLKVLKSNGIDRNVESCGNCCLNNQSSQINLKTSILGDNVLEKRNCSVSDASLRDRKKSHRVAEGGGRRWQSLVNGVSDKSFLKGNSTDGTFSLLSMQTQLNSPGRVALLTDSQLISGNLYNPSSQNGLFDSSGLSRPLLSNSEKKNVNSKHSKMKLDKRGKLSSSDHLRNTKVFEANELMNPDDPFSEENGEFQYKKYMRLLRSNSFGSIGNLSGKTYSIPACSDPVSDLSSSILANHLRTTMSSFAPSAFLIRLSQENSENSLYSKNTEYLNGKNDGVLETTTPSSMFERKKVLRNKHNPLKPTNCNTIFRTITDIDIGDDTDINSVKDAHTNNENKIGMNKTRDTLSNNHKPDTLKTDSKHIVTGNSIQQVLKDAARRNSIALCGNWSGLDSTNAIDWLSKRNCVKPSVFPSFEKEVKCIYPYMVTPEHATLARPFEPPVCSLRDDLHNGCMAKDLPDGLSTTGPIPYENWRTICSPRKGNADSQPVPINQQNHARKKCNKNSYNFYASPRNIYKLSENELDSSVNAPAISYQYNTDLNYADSHLRNNCTCTRRRNSISAIDDSRNSTLLSKSSNERTVTCNCQTPEKFIFGGRRNSKFLTPKTTEYSPIIPTLDTIAFGTAIEEALKSSRNHQMNGDLKFLERFPEHLNSEIENNSLKSDFCEDSELNDELYQQAKALLTDPPQKSTLGKDQIENSIPFNPQILNCKDSLRHENNNSGKNSHLDNSNLDKMDCSVSNSVTLLDSNLQQQQQCINDQTGTVSNKTYEHINGYSISSCNEYEATSQNGSNESISAVTNNRLVDKPRFKINHSFGFKNFQNSITGHNYPEKVGNSDPCDEKIDRIFPSRKVSRRMTSSGLVRPALQKFVSLGAQRLLRKPISDNFNKDRFNDSDRLLTNTTIVEDEQSPMLNHNNQASQYYSELINEDKRSNSSESSYASVTDGRNATQQYQSIDEITPTANTAPIIRPPRRNKLAKKTKQIRFILHPETNGTSEQLIQNVTKPHENESRPSANDDFDRFVDNIASASCQKRDQPKSFFSPNIEKNSSNVKKKILNKVRKKIKSSNRSAASQSGASKTSNQVRIYMQM